MAVEARAPCGDCNNNSNNNNNNNNNKVILIVILINVTTYSIFMTVFTEIFWSSHEIIFIVNRKVRVRVNWVKTDLWHPDNNSDLSLEAESAEMCYLFEGMTWDAGAFSSGKGKCGLGGSRMGTKQNKIAKAGRPCSWECYEKNGNILLFINIFFSTFWLTLKPAE
jgi:hypothetical protein